MPIPRARYSVRTALVAVTIIAILFAYLARQEAMRRALIAEIVDAGGSVEFDASTWAWCQSLRVSKITTSGWRWADRARFRCFQNLSEIDLTDCVIIDDEGVEHHTTVRVTKQDLLDCYVGNCKDVQCPLCSYAVSNTDANR